MSLETMEAEARRRRCARLVTQYKAVNVAAGRCYASAGLEPDQPIVSKPLAAEA